MRSSSCTQQAGRAGAAGRGAGAKSGARQAGDAGDTYQRPSPGDSNTSETTASTPPRVRPWGSTALACLPLVTCKPRLLRSYNND